MMSAVPNPEPRLKFSRNLRWEDFVQALVAASRPALERNEGKGPIFPLRSIRVTELDAPAAMRDLMLEIVSSSAVVDHSAKPGSINDETVGAMRQIHANDPAYLPRFNYYTTSHGQKTLAPELSSRASKYEEYVVSFKSHSNDRGGGAKTTGYVEYTAGDNTMYDQGNRARIAWDYVNSKLYFSPLHYSCWKLAVPSTGPGTIVDKPLDDGYISPWFWIIDIPQAG